jgi:hypothetical protein
MSPEREIEYQKLVNAIFLEVFKWPRMRETNSRNSQFAKFDFQCVAWFKEGS